MVKRSYTNKHLWGSVKRRRKCQGITPSYGESNVGAWNLISLPERRPW